MTFLTEQLANGALSFIGAIPFKEIAFDAALWQAVAIIFLATFIRSVFGFGEALVAVPLLAFIMPVDTAVPIATLVSITMAAVVVMQDWQHVHLRSAGRLFLASVAGIPVGLLLLTTVPEGVLKTVLAVVIITFSTYSLIRRNNTLLENDRSEWLFGLFSGILGGAYSMNGPPLAVYGALRGWSPQHFRATLQGYFLPASVVVMVGYWSVGLWTPAVNYYYVASVPGVIIATLLGRVVNRHFRGPAFLRFVYVFLIIVGGILLQQVLAR